MAPTAFCEKGPDGRSASADGRTTGRGGFIALGNGANGFLRKRLRRSSTMANATAMLTRARLQARAWSASADGRTTGRGGFIALGNGANGFLRKRLRRSSTMANATAMLTRARLQARAWSASADGQTTRRGGFMRLGQWRQRPLTQKAEAVEHCGRRNPRAHTSLAVAPPRP